MTDIGQKYELDKALSGSESPKEPVKVDMQAAHEAQEVAKEQGAYATTSAEDPPSEQMGNHHHHGHGAE